MFKYKIFPLIACCVTLTGILSSCSKEEEDLALFSKDELIGIYYGTHDVLGTIPINDTLTVMASVKDSVSISSKVLNVSFNASFDVRTGNLNAPVLVSDSLMIEPSINIYAKNISGSGKAKFGTDKRTLITDLKATADVYNVGQIIPGGGNPTLLKDAGFPGSFTKQ